jgi:predicted Zn-dependent peptidase
MAVVAVGDCDPAVMRERIEAHFGNLPARAGPAEPEPGDPMADWHRAAALLPESEATLTRITLAVINGVTFYQKSGLRRPQPPGASSMVAGHRPPQ